MESPRELLVNTQHCTLVWGSPEVAVVTGMWAEGIFLESNLGKSRHSSGKVRENARGSVTSRNAALYTLGEVMFSRPRQEGAKAFIHWFTKVTVWGLSYGYKHSVACGLPHTLAEQTSEFWEKIKGAAFRDTLQIMAGLDHSDSCEGYGWSTDSICYTR